MASPYYQLIRGKFAIVGYEPDGDSVRFIADDATQYHALHRHDRLNLSRRDGSVQLRFEGVDATELHYGSAEQPLGKEARDQLLSWMGFGNIVYASAESTKIKEAAPAAVRGGILTQAVESNGRPVSYVMLEHDLPSHGDWIRMDAAALSRTLDFKLLETGMAYYTVYTSMPYEQRRVFREVAANARAAGRGVWAADETRDFVLIDQASIGPHGQCILPKLFRRCTDYLKDVDKGFQGNLTDWLVWISQSKSRNENDLVVVHDWFEVPLSFILQQQNRHLAFKADLLDLVFVEK